MFVGDVDQVSGKARSKQSTKEVDAQANPPTKKVRGQGSALLIVRQTTCLFRL